MLIDKFPINYKRVVNLFTIICLILGAIGGTFGGMVIGAGMGLSILFGMLGTIVGPILTYVVLILFCAPALLIFNILVNLNVVLIKKAEKKDE